MCETLKRIGSAACHFCSNPDKNICLKNVKPWGVDNPLFQATGQQQLDKFQLKLGRHQDLITGVPNLLKANQALQSMATRAREGDIFAKLGNVPTDKEAWAIAMVGGMSELALLAAEVGFNVTISSAE